MFTDSPAELVQAEERHRDHLIVKQSLAGWTDGPLAYMPYVEGSSPPTRPGWPAPPSRTTCCVQHGRRTASPTARPAWPPSAAISSTSGRPHRPARPRPHHAVPTCRLAPRTRVANPVRCRLRAADGTGLLPPTASRTRQRPQRPPRTLTRAANPDKAAGTVSGKASHAPISLKTPSVNSSGERYQPVD